MKQIYKVLIISIIAGFLAVGTFATIALTTQSYAQVGEPVITEDEAKQIAEDYTNGTAISIESEVENGVLIYEVQIQTATEMIEVEIDSNTGVVLEVEIGDDD